jgi:hypothetical protein
MTRTREEMRLYQRERRARLKASKPVIDRDWAVADTTLPRYAITGASDAEYERLRVKAAAIGRGPVITHTNGRLDVLSREAFEARPVAPSRSVAPYKPPAPLSPDAIRGSMVAIGGRPGPGLVRQGYGYAAPPDLAAVSPYTRAEEFQAKSVAMFAAQAAETDALKRRVVALEAAAADRRANASEVAQAFFGLIQFGLTGRAR